MEPAVKAKLAGVVCQVTLRDVFEDANFGFKPRDETALWLVTVPTAGGISGSRRRSSPDFANGKAIIPNCFPTDLVVE